jgi:hypothetical protein
VSLCLFWKKGGGMAQAGNHLPSKCEALSSNPSTAKKENNNTNWFWFLCSSLSSTFSSGSSYFPVHAHTHTHTNTHTLCSPLSCLYQIFQTLRGYALSPYSPREVFKWLLSCLSFLSSQHPFLQPSLLSMEI